jgi:HlyD family secretion protein
VKPAVRWSLIVAAVVVAVLALRATVFKPRPLEVDAARVVRGTVEDAVTNSEAGTVRSRERARLGAELGGRVRAIPRREGSSFRKGEVLVQLDPDASRMRLDLARREAEAAAGAVSQARAAASLADVEYNRVAPLGERGLASPGELDASRARRDQTHAALQAAQAREASARSQIGLAQNALVHVAIVAPFDGVVSQRFVEVGEMLTPGQPALEVLNPRRLYVSAPLDEMDIARVRVGLPTRVTLDPYPGRSWKGTVSRVAPFVNDVVQQNRTLEIEVELALDASEPLPKPGTSADIEVILDHHAGVLRVPTFAVIEGHRVLVIERGRAVARDVTVGLRNWEWTEITGGLHEGETVITSLDQTGVKAGAAVRAKAASPAAVPRRARR